MSATILRLIVASGGDAIAGDFDGGFLPDSQFGVFAVLLAASSPTPSICIVRAPVGGWYIARADAYAVSGLEFLPKKAPPVAHQPHPTSGAAFDAVDCARQGAGGCGGRRAGDIAAPLVITGRAIKVVPQ